MLLTSLIGFGVSIGPADAKSLGGYPLCEASAAIPINCPDGQACILVADNEIRDTLFRFRVRDDKIDVDSRTALRFVSRRRDNGPARASRVTISDVEALANGELDRVLIVGSHSRNHECKSRKKRRRYVFGRLRVEDIGPDPAGVTNTKKRTTCSQLFVAFASPWPEEVNRLCARLTETEVLAERARKEAPLCSGDALNIEAAVSVIADRGEREYWLGLRAPLVDGKAPLVRLDTTRSHLAFDRVRLIDLGHRGWRELATAGPDIYGIAGPATDAGDGAFELVRFSIDSLAGDGPIAVSTIGKPLPRSSEGLAIVGEVAFVMTDGVLVRGGESCRQPSKYFTRRLPDG
ncbi:MAG: hypothetical protein AAF493_14790 [Pseudomonadota bacterium]